MHRFMIRASLALALVLFVASAFAQAKKPKPVPPKSPKVLVMTIDQFEKDHGAQCPKQNNLAAQGTAVASSTHPRRDEVPMILRGVRRGDVWCFSGDRGTLAVKWPDPPVARVLLLFARTHNTGMDPWGEAGVKINGGKRLDLPGMAGGKVAVVVMNEDVAVESVEIDIRGEGNPGVAGLELHAGR